MFKKLCAVLLISLMLLGTVCFAASTPATNENVVFTYKASGNVVDDYLSAEAIIAKTVYYNNTASEKHPILLVSSYNAGGALTDVWYNTVDISVAPNSQATVSVEFTPTVGNTVKATLFDGLKTSAFKPMTKEANMSVDSTDLAAITVNGTRLADFSNAKNEYLIQSADKFTVSAEAKDGSTKVDVKMPDSIPGTAEIDVTSASGISKKVYVTCYEEEAQLLTLKDLKFNVDGQSYSIPNFDPNVTEYTVNINEVTGNANANYFYTTIEPVLVATGSDVYVNALDVNKESVNGVKYTYNTTSHFTYQFAERKTFDNKLPIKNEETKAIISVARDGGKKTYTVTFTAKQPRLLEYNVCTDDGAPQPTFIGGAAVNNDNGTSFTTDRSFVMCNISENLVGTSLFHAIFGIKDSYATWWNGKTNTNPPTEYFNFKADTAGTVIVMPYNVGANVYKNEQDGWVNVSSSAPTVDSQGQTLVLNDKSVTYNDYPAGTYYINEQTLLGTRYLEDSYTFSTSREARSTYYAYEKTFNANETVSIPVWSTGGGAGDALGLVMIRWAE